MAKVIVPKDYVYKHTISVSEITASNIIGSTHTINFQLRPEESRILGFNITINYGLSNSTANVQWSSSAIGAKEITIKNDYPFGCNFIILTVTGLPKIRNTGTTSGAVALRLRLNTGTTIVLNSFGVPAGITLTPNDETYYIDLKSLTVTTDPGSTICNKAITYNSTYWTNSQYSATIPNITSDPFITLSNPFPDIINNYSLTFDDSTNLSRPSPDLTIYINSDSEQSDIEHNKYLKLHLSGNISYVNNTSFKQYLTTHLSVNDVTILLNSVEVKPGFNASFFTGQTHYIDLVENKLVNKNDISKAITHL